jgi:uncharacterized metal-binding protein YceD (DUF177 family)
MSERPHLINLWRPDLEIADKDEIEAEYPVDPFELHGRDHEVKNAGAHVGITRFQDGVHLDIEVRCEVETTCDRTLEPVTLTLCFGDSELVSGPSEPELGVEDWMLNLSLYTRESLPAEVPMQVFAPDSEAVDSGPPEDEVDPRWRGLDDLFASGS